jgi:D-alanyl-D-alanine carboxypeptidase (penicillin-binding protein 5/6)
MAYPLFAELVDTPYLVFPPAPDGTARGMENTNVLLTTYPGVVGVKTGWTREAGRVLVTLYERDGRRVWVVAMGSDDAFVAATRLLDYSLYRFTKLDWRRALVTPVRFVDGRAA